MIKQSEFSNIVSATTKYFFEADGETVGWYDSTALSTITKDASNFVSRWNDKLGSGHDLLQASGTNQPELRADGMFFDGIDNFFKTAPFAYEQPEYVYLVMKQITWSSLDAIFDGNTSTSGVLWQTGSSPNLSTFAGAGVNNNQLALDTWGIVRVLFNGIPSLLQINANAPVTGNSGTSDMGGITMGSRGQADTRYAHMMVKEAIFRKAADSEANSNKIYNYLKSKYSL